MRVDSIKLSLLGFQELSRQQMKKITGGYARPCVSQCLGPQVNDCPVDQYGNPQNCELSSMICHNPDGSLAPPPYICVDNGGLGNG
jgi:hypothetical protein